MGGVRGIDPKREIRRAFDRSAIRYDRFARLQRQVADRLLALLPWELPSGWWVDLGSGTGYCGHRLRQRSPGRNLLFLDLAEAMVRQTGGVVGDIERLPLRDRSASLLLSNLAFQWCLDPGRPLLEAKRVLRPGGLLAFSTLVEGTLWELKAAWRAVDGDGHVNDFVSFEEIQARLETTGWSGRLFRERRVLRYATVFQLLQELKGVGTRNLHPSRPRALTTRSKLREMARSYSEICGGEVRATFEIAYAICRELDPAEYPRKVY